jgi:hypothetical protein
MQAAFAGGLFKFNINEALTLKTAPATRRPE